MKNTLCWVLLGEIFLNYMILISLVLPMVIFIVMAIIYKQKPNNADKAYSEAGERWKKLGILIILSELVLFIGLLLYGYNDRQKANENFENSLRVRFKNYYTLRKSYTQRLVDFANRIPDTQNILNDMKSFAEHLPKEERVIFGRTWAASIHGGRKVQDKNGAISGIESRLYWPDEKIEKYKRTHGGIRPEGTELRYYSREQIKAFKASNWSKLYPLLDQYQWKHFYSRMLDISQREDVIGFLWDVADCFQPEGNPLKSLENLYDTLAQKACPTPREEIICYLEGYPQLIFFYKFSLKHRWWFTYLIPALVTMFIGLLICISGGKLVSEGKKTLFK